MNEKARRTIIDKPRLQLVLSHTLGTTMCELKYFVLQRKLATRFYGTANVTMLWQILR